MNGSGVWFRPRVFVAVILIIGLAVWVAVAVGLTYTHHPRQAWPDIRSTLHWLGVAATTLPRNLAVVFLVIAFCGTMAGPGTLVLRAFRIRPADAWEWVACSVAAGLAGWVPIVLFFGWAIGLSRPDVLIPTVVYLLPGPYLLAKWALSPCRPRRPVLSVPKRPVRSWMVDGALVVAVVVLGYLMVLGALAPETGFDARWYHLGAAFHYVEVGHFYNIVAATHDPAMGLNPYQEISYTGLLSLFGVHAAKLLAFADAVLLFGCIVAFSRVHFRSTRLGIVAACACLSLPVVSWSATTANNDLPVAIYTLLGIHSLLHWVRDRRQWKWAYLSITFAGFSAGVKAFGIYTVILIVAVVIGYVIRDRGPGDHRNIARRFTAMALLICVACSPWWIRDGEMTGNPVFPAANGIFHSMYWNAYASAAQGFDNRHVSLLGTPFGLAATLWETVSTPVRFHNLVGPFFLVAIPASVVLVLACRPRQPRPLVIISGFTILWSAAWYLSGQSDSRYLIGVAPLACLAVAQVIRSAYLSSSVVTVVPVVFTAALVAIGISTLQPFIPLVRTANPQLLEGVVPYQWNYLFRHEPEADVQQDVLPMVKYIDRHLDEHTAKVYDGVDLLGMYLYVYPELFNGFSYGSPATMHQWSINGPDAYERFAANKITNVVVFASTVPSLRRDAIGRHLRVEYRSPDGEVLFRVVP